ncbi:hypothetical protein [Spiroplasma endosymbiont of Diplazon laetatorius]|uniref:hypothetical protein n=1 Tax=Spiroplasma endosymbiont of Diplazon laetatorius TaxID=3066322 RepID=UPI0030D2C21D
MNKLYKKMLASFSMFAIIPTATLSVVSCGGNYWDNIWRPEPIMPVIKEGFENVNLDNIDTEKIFYTDELLNQILSSLKNSGYERDDLNIQLFKNGIEYDLKTTDIFRNANYKFVITNKNNEKDKITASIKITNSLYLQDVFKVTNIGNVYDHRPRTIMMGLMFYNMDMIPQLSRVGNELTKAENYIYNQDLNGVTIKINDKIPDERPTGYYGSLDVSYNIEKFTPSNNDEYPMTIQQMVKASNGLDKPKTELGTLSGKDQYTVLMQFIIENLTNSIYWALFVNDLDLDNFKAIPIDGQVNKYKMMFSLKPYGESNEIPDLPTDQNGEYDKKAHYLKDENGIELTFSYFG